MFGDAITQDVTGVPVTITGQIVTSNLGTPPSVNPALIDADTGQLIAEAQPAKINQWYDNPVVLILGAGVIWWLLMGRRK